MPQSINISSNSYENLARLQHLILKSDTSRIILDFLDTQYVDAIYMAFIGGLQPLCNKKHQLLTYRLDPHSKLYRYFKTSGLYEYIKHGKSYTNKNAIPFSEIHMEEDSIIDYINKILDLAPITLSPKASSHLFSVIYEIFSNSSDHSEADNGVFACGHWMPTKNQLVFSVYDTGIGIPGAIKKFINPEMPSDEALKWALKIGNSTKQLKHGVPRGVGLPNLLDFINANNSSFYILSNDIYYSFEKGVEKFTPLKHSIVGTMISFVIISDEKHIYKLKEELE